MDLQIAIFMNQLGAGTLLDPISQFISDRIFLIIFFTAVAAATLFFDKTKGKKVFIAIIAAVILHFLISEGVIKYLLGNFLELRIRPYIAHPGQIIAIGKEFADSSFPSSHMAIAAAILTVLTYFYRKSWLTLPLAVLFLLAMAFSRIHNGMHYPIDVFFGTIFGVIYGTAGIFAAKKFK